MTAEEHSAKHPQEPRDPSVADEAVDPSPADPDAWATACGEDLAAEEARRRERYGPEPLDPARELRRLADTVTEHLGRLGGGLGLGAAPLAHQARAALEPVIERNADVLNHLARAGQELLAAYRSAVEGHERDWTRPPEPRRETPTASSPDGPDGPPPAADGDDGPPDAAGPHRIDLD
ncbi:DUF5304 family protein [Streptomyces sp. 4N509B]|uniref:DUF5304 family protein n=1 Tax=Streptomyces sp. 4N509B TaxID=3457413 RepID=UPI003FD2FC10